MEYKDILERIWQYSKYYSEMIATSVRLNNIGESYAALLVLFNTMELLFKSIRGTDSTRLVDDIEWLKTNGYISSEEYTFLNDEDGGIRVLRNKMTHKDCYEYCIDINDKAYPFADKETWDFVFELVFPSLLAIFYNIIRYPTE
jgi:hypothetical protein